MDIQKLLVLICWFAGVIMSHGQQIGNSNTLHFFTFLFAIVKCLMYHQYIHVPSIIILLVHCMAHQAVKQETIVFLIGFSFHTFHQLNICIFLYPEILFVFCLSKGPLAQSLYYKHMINEPCIISHVTKPCPYKLQ